MSARSELRAMTAESNRRLNTILALEAERNQLRDDLLTAQKLQDPANDWSDDAEDCGACAHIETDYCPYHKGKIAGQIAVRHHVEKALEMMDG